MEKIIVNLDYADKNFSAGTGEINGVVIATGKTLDEVKKEFKSAFEFHVEACREDKEPLPKWVLDGDYEFEYNYTVSALLQYFDGVLTRSALARVTGINERQLGHYATGYRKPRPKQRERIVAGFHKLGKEFISVV